TMNPVSALTGATSDRILDDALVHELCLRAMAEAGFADLVEAMDATNLVRVAPAMTWPGDILAGPGRERGPFRFSLSVVHTHGAVRTLAFGPDGVCGVGTPDLSLDGFTAWRVARG
uniref:hypothetical protein n=1 Tax=uncultured Brevundimonas sp. TaxID=213418 RepID=UPI002613AB90